MRVALEVCPTPRLMVRSHSALWPVCVYWAILKRLCTGEQTPITSLHKAWLILLRYLDLPALISWLCQRQQPSIGGLGGRSNKLVDGCYSHWIGGCFALVEAAIRDDFLAPIWDREALARYLLCCTQGQRGGLRDKPGKQVEIATMVDGVRC